MVKVERDREVELRVTGGREFEGVKENGTLHRQHNGFENFLFYHWEAVE